MKSHANVNPLFPRIKISSKIASRNVATRLHCPSEYAHVRVRRQETGAIFLHSHISFMGARHIHACEPDHADYALHSGERPRVSEAFR